MNVCGAWWDAPALDDAQLLDQVWREGSIGGEGGIVGDLNLEQIRRENFTSHDAARFPQRAVALEERFTT